MPLNHNLFLNGFVGDYAFNAATVEPVLSANRDNPVSFLVFSYGGYTAEALAISELIRSHGNVTCHIIGLTASAATIAIMGAAKITISKSAGFLVHKCASMIDNFSVMTADDIRSFIDSLSAQAEHQDSLDQCVASLYAQRCKKSTEELLALMQEDRWLSPEEALEWGFVDEISEVDDEPDQEQTSVSADRLRSCGLPVPEFLPRRESAFTRFVSSLRDIMSPASQQSQSSEQSSDLTEIRSQLESNSSEISRISSLMSEIEQRLKDLEEAPGAPVSTAPTTTSGSEQTQPAVDPQKKSREILNSLNSII